MKRGAGGWAGDDIAYRRTRRTGGRKSDYPTDSAAKAGASRDFLDPGDFASAGSVAKRDPNPNQNCDAHSSLVANRAMKGDQIQSAAILVFETASRSFDMPNARLVVGLWAIVLIPTTLIAICAETGRLSRQGVDAPAEALDTPSSSNFALSNPRGGDRPLATLPRSNYNYDPSIVEENGVYRLYWCASEPAHRGDNILHAEATSLAGPWHAHGSSIPDSYNDVFWGTGDDRDFDGLHVCDPSVIKANGTYYMYYTGAHIAGAIGPNAIGVASSPDGLSWTRLNGGRPILSPANKRSPPTDAYGAGEPTVTYAKDLNGTGWFYLLYNDHSGEATYANGAGEYVLRSTDPTFRQDTETLTRSGWRSLNASTNTSYVIFNGNNVDIQYLELSPTQPEANRFLFLSHSDANKTHVIVADLNFHIVLDQTIAPSQWCDGPGVVSIAEGRQAVISGASGGWKISLDFLRAIGDCSNPATWRLAWRGADLFLPEGSDRPGPKASISVP